MHTDDEGTIQIVHGGSEFRNPVEKALANFILSGNENFLNAIPNDVYPSFMLRSVQNVTSALGYNSANTTIGDQVIEFDPLVITAAVLAISKQNKTSNNVGAVPPVTKIHGNSNNSKKPTWLYKLVDKQTSAVMKYGVTSADNPSLRYKQWFYRLYVNNHDIVRVLS